MARIRTIKPEFWQDEKLARIPRDARLMFIGLWNVADDEGRLRGSPLFIRAQVFPYDLDVDVDGCLGQLERLDCIERYSVQEESFIWVRHFAEHQKIDRPKPSVLPAPTPRDRSTIDRRSIDDASTQKTVGREGKGMEGKGTGSAAAPPPPKVPAKPSTVDPSLRDLMDAEFAKARGCPYAWSTSDETAVGSAIIKADLKHEEVLRRWSLALKRTAYPVCNGVVDLNKHWNAYAAEQTTGPPGKAKRAGERRGAEEFNWKDQKPEISDEFK